MYHIFIHFPVDGHLGYFHVLAIINSASETFLSSISDSIQVLLTLPYNPSSCPHLFISLGNRPTACLLVLNYQKKTTWALGWEISEVGSGPFSPHLLGHSWVPARNKCSSRVPISSFSPSWLPEVVVKSWPWSTPTRNSSVLGIVPQKVSRNEGTCREMTF